MQERRWERDQLVERRKERELRALSTPLNAIKDGTGGGIRTRKPKRRILSPMCMPIPPLPQSSKPNFQNFPRGIFEEARDAGGGAFFAPPPPYSKAGIIAHDTSIPQAITHKTSIFSTIFNYFVTFLYKFIKSYLIISSIARSISFSFSASLN